MAPLIYRSLLKVFILFGTIGFIYGANLRCYEGYLNNFTEISLENPETLLNSSCFNVNKDTMIYAFGFQENATDFTVNNIIGTYLGLNYNTLLLNWEEEASVPLLGSASYGIVVLNTRTVGKKLGEAIVKLCDAGFYLPSLHLLGFSLGAHLMGYAGKEVKNHKLLVSRMTLFDPAGPLYEVVGPFSGADKDCAKFVVVIHGNPGKLGTVDNVGTVDFWPNCGSSIQPGCELHKSEQFPPDACSHSRAWVYYLESLKRRKAFPARAASSCGAWKAGRGTDQIIYMGSDIDVGIEGKFYLRTNSEELFGLGEEGTQPSKTDNGLDVGLDGDLHDITYI